MQYDAKTELLCRVDAVFDEIYKFKRGHAIIEVHVNKDLDYVSIRYYFPGHTSRGTYYKHGKGLPAWAAEIV